jgi:hypothetical protein
MTSDDREVADRKSAWSQQGDEPQSEIDYGSDVQELMERGLLWRSKRRRRVLPK